MRVLRQLEYCNFSGESGAGKTESAKLLISQLVELSKGTSQLEQQILQVLLIIVKSVKGKVPWCTHTISQSMKLVLKQKLTETMLIMRTIRVPNTNGFKKL